MKDRMISPRLRPRFEIHVPVSMGELSARLSQRLQFYKGAIVGSRAGNHFHLIISKPHQRLWSPHLGIELEQTPEGTLVRGHFGPRPDIWTLVIAIYAITGFLTFMALLFALSQWMLGMPAWSLWIAVGAMSIAALVYALAIVGQSLSQPQMHTLLRCVEDATGQQLHPH